MMPSKTLIALLLLPVAAATANAQTSVAADAQPAAPKAPPMPAPTLANIAYGSDPAQVLDFYKVESDKPTPLMFFIHGGGWVAGTKNQVSGIHECLAAGISVVSVEYRFVQKAQLAGVKPPVKWPLEDAARALQFVRSKAAEWNIDKQRIGASGGSAGACSSLYLAFHNDMADPNSSDPIARESTRLWCAAVSGAQTSLDPLELKEWTPNSRYGGHAFGFWDPNDRKTRDTRFAEFLANRDSVLQWIKQYSPIEHVTADDPPVYLYYTSAPALGQEQRDPTHTANYGAKLQEKCRKLGVSCELYYPGAPDAPHKSTHEYLIERLKASK
jgi:acetyl esterase/lipase